MCMKLLQKIPTGCKGLDEALEGGLTVGDISLIYGEAETAKTTLAIQCAVNCARNGYKTLFVDCDGAFSPRRLSQIASEDAEKIAEHIILARPKDFKEQTTLIDQLTSYLTKDFGLVVFDTITYLYRLEVAEKPEKTFELNRELNRQMAWLAQVAKTHKIAILAVSQVRGVFEDMYVAVEPVATRVLKFWANAIIAFKPTENAKIVKAVIEKKSGAPQQSTSYLKISGTGLSEIAPST
ncbi:MAG: ATPase domain-containing protein [Candidatus Bathyarchaeia archaeon]